MANAKKEKDINNNAELQRWKSQELIETFKNEIVLAGYSRRRSLTHLAPLIASRARFDLFPIAFEA